MKNQCSILNLSRMNYNRDARAPSDSKMINQALMKTRCIKLAKRMWNGQGPSSASPSSYLKMGNLMRTWMVKCRNCNLIQNNSSLYTYKKPNSEISSAWGWRNNIITRNYLPKRKKSSRSTKQFMLLEWPKPRKDLQSTRPSSKNIPSSPGKETKIR